MTDVTNTFFTALAAVASAAVIAVSLADLADSARAAPASIQWAKQTLPGPQADQASRPRG